MSNKCLSRAKDGSILSWPTIMGHYKLWTVDCYSHSLRYDMAVNRGAVGHLRCLVRSPTTLQRRRYVEQMLEPCKRWFYTIMANYNGPLQAVDCYSHSVRYDMAVNRVAVGHLRCLIRSPTTLQRLRYVEQMLEPCKRWFYTIMADYNGPLQAVDCYSHSVRYDMALESKAGSHLRRLIRSPTTLQRRRYDQNEPVPCKRWFYTIMANYNGPLQAVDCYSHRVRYDMALESKAIGHLRCLIRSSKMTHQHG
eukprot:scaffold6348_cov108-Skeletonema_marinoi.AAC.2